MSEPLKYKPEYCQMLIDHMSDGSSFRTFVIVTKCSRKVMYEWVEKYPEFALAKEIAFAKALEFFEDGLKLKASGRKQTEAEKRLRNVDKIDMGAITFPLKTRFHEEYGDRLKTEEVEPTESYESRIERVTKEKLERDRRKENGKRKERDREKAKSKSTKET